MKIKISIVLLVIVIVIALLLINGVIKNMRSEVGDDTNLIYLGTLGSLTTYSIAGDSMYFQFTQKVVEVNVNLPKLMATHSIGVDSIIGTRNHQLTLCSWTNHVRQKTSDYGTSITIVNGLLAQEKLDNDVEVQVHETVKVEKCSEPMVLSDNYPNSLGYFYSINKLSSASEKHLTLIEDYERPKLDIIDIREIEKYLTRYEILEDIEIILIEKISESVYLLTDTHSGRWLLIISSRDS